MVQATTQWNEELLDAVRKGLTGPRKALPSWLFYDDVGDRIFQQIMRMPEYYPTRCEYDILQEHKSDLRKHFPGKRGSFRLIELGAGDGLKTEILLKDFLEHEINFTYIPVDISANVLNQLSLRLSAAYPRLHIRPLNKTYDDAFAALRAQDEKKVVLFMGANIGNFAIPEASRFLRRMILSLQDEDMVLIGFDLKKDPRIIQEAYDDPRGLTRAFNLNLLTRLNRELGADFDVDLFSHYPYYDPYTGTTKSFLISMKDQHVHVAALETTIHLDLWEPVQTEVSQKYDPRMIEKLLSLTGLRIVDTYYDADRYFCDVLAKPVAL